MGGFCNLDFSCINSGPGESFADFAGVTKQSKMTLNFYIGLAIVDLVISRKSAKKRIKSSRAGVVTQDFENMLLLACGGV